VAQDINLLIGTPAYGGLVHVEYVSALLLFQRLGVAFALMTIGNESLITRARNSIISAFHQRREYTHLLFLDGDVHLPLEGLRRLLAHRKDVIGAPVPLKGPSPDAGRVFNVGNAVGEEGPLVVVDRVGTAVLMLSRAAVDALIAEAKREQRVYEPNPLMQGAGEGAIQYDVFQVGVVDGEYLAEDFWVCHVLRRLGFPIHVDPAIVTRHNGVVAL
jgi:hypothetical protein